MTGLSELFCVLVSLSVKVLPVMAAVGAARWLLRRAPKKYAYALWAVVGYRLMMPPGLITATPWSLFNLRPLQAVAETAGTVAASGGKGLPLRQLAQSAGIAQQAAGSGPNAAVLLSGSELAVRICGVVWLAGLAGIAVYSVLSCLRLRRSLAEAVLRDTNVYEAQGLATPFVLGFFRPRIYLPLGLDADQRTYVLCHERFHLRRRDQWWKLLAFALAAVYWWNPTVWGCYALFCRDLEMSCDEAVLAQLGGGARRGYSLSLVDFAAARRLSPANPLAFGETDAGRRVRHVLSWRRETPRVTFLAVCVALAILLGCTTDAAAGSWVRISGASSAPGAAYTVQIAPPVNAWAIFQDVYQEGRLVSSQPCVFAPLPSGNAPVRFSSQVVCQTARDSLGSLAGELEVSVTGDGLNSRSTASLPKRHYTGCGSVVGDGGGNGGREKLSAGGSRVLLTVLLSTEADGGIKFYNAGQSLIAANDTVVQFRFAVTAEGVAAFSSDFSQPVGTLTPERVDSGAPYPASWGHLCQFAAELSGGTRYTLSAVTYVDGAYRGETELAAGLTEELGSEFWLSACVDKGAWDAVYWNLYPGKDEACAAEAAPLTGHAPVYSSIAFSSLGQDAEGTALTAAGRMPLLAVCLSKGQGEPVTVPCETLSDPAALEKLAADNSAVSVAFLELSGSGGDGTAPR